MRIIAERARDRRTPGRLCKNAGMSAPDPQRPPLFPPRALMLVAIAFAVGLLLFLLVWLRSRHDYDFYKADGSQAAAGQSDALPAPLPPDVAGSDGASGLQVTGKGSSDDAAAAASADRPRIAETPANPASSPAPTPAAPTSADRTLPEPLNAPSPRYPPEALRMGIGGTVRVRVVVAADGSAERQELAEASGNRFLDRAALETVRRWRFRPATRNGQPVAAEVVVPIVFNPGR